MEPKEIQFKYKITLLTRIHSSIGISFQPDLYLHVFVAIIFVEREDSTISDRV